MKLRDGLSDADRGKKSALIAREFMNRFSSYDRFALYCPIRSEVDTFAIINGLLALDKKIWMPKVTGDSVELGRCGSVDALCEGYHGILEPETVDTDVKIQVIVVPGVAFDKRGYRIGYGKGFYDRLLNSMNKVLKVGLAFQVQLTEKVPNEVFDKRVDAIITEGGIIECEKYHTGGIKHLQG